MNKERNVSETTATVFFNGDVQASKLNQLFQDFQGDIIITGNLILDEEDLSIECNNLYVMGDMSSVNNMTEVKGNLYVGGAIDCNDIRVNGSVYAYGNKLDAIGLDVAEDLYAANTVNSANISVGGEFTCQCVNALTVNVLKKMNITDQIITYGSCYAG